MSILLAAATISGSNIGAALIWLVVAGLIFWIVSWGLGKIGLPEPFAKIAWVLLIVLTVVVCVNALLLLVGHPLFTVG